MSVAQPETKIVVGLLLAGKYKVTRELGRGGMAAVYEAEHINIGKKVAVKVLAAELTNSAVVIERFFREARAAASVKSPYIVEVYDSGRLEDGRPFIAMELLEGESLYDRMARVRLIDPMSTVRIITQVAKGLVKAHAVGIVHRDLKPENIHLCKGEDGEEIAKILDFGLAKFYAPMKTDAKTARLTREGAVFGTPAYMSPEQVKGQGSVDHRADLWALGCMAYECLTGRPVWNTDQGVAMTFAAIAAAPLPMPRKLRPDLPAALDEWFKKALQREPNKRFQSAKELADDLSRALGAPQISLFNIIGSAPSQQDLEAIANKAEELPADLVESVVPPPAPSKAPGAVKQTTPGIGLNPGDVSLTPSPPKPANVPGDALDRVARRPQGMSASDLPPTAGPDAPPPPSQVRAARSGAVRWAVSAAALAGVVVAGWLVYSRVTRPASALAPAAPSAAASASAAASTADSNAASAPLAPMEQPKWMAAIEEAQKLLASGDPDAALRKLKEASDAGAGPIGKSFADQMKIGTATTGPCRMTAFSHPRFGYAGNVGRPAVAATSKGTIVAWTDDHEQPGHDHVYSVLLDPTGRPTSRPRDLTPEADNAMRPALLAATDDRVALLFWDKSGREAGVRVRGLDADGRIGAMSTPVGGSKPGMFWPAMERVSDGTFWVAWQEGRDKEGDDVFLRHLDAELQPMGGELRATDYAADKGKPVRASMPAIAASGANLFLAYALERDRQHLIERVRAGIGTPDLQSGLPDKGGAKDKDRTIGDAAAVNDNKAAGGDYPAMACSKDACFLVWHELPKGAEAALVDPVKGTALWRKRFAPLGGHPAVATGDGQVEVAFFESGRVRTAALSRDGVGTTSTFAKVTGDPPRPWISPGRAHGEWHVAWLDLEAGHTEVFVARLQCRN